MKNPKKGDTLNISQDQTSQLRKRKHASDENRNSTTSSQQPESNISVILQDVTNIPHTNGDGTSLFFKAISIAIPV